MIAAPTFSKQIEDRLRFLARKMLRQFPLVRRWEETDDVLQEASLRLHLALPALTPETELHFYRTAALQVRRVLLDLAERHSNPLGFAANYETGFGEKQCQCLDDRLADRECCFTGIEAWMEFHRIAGTLPIDQQDVFDLLWYDGVKQDDAAKILGLPKRTLQRRWREVRLELVEQLDGVCPS